MEPNAYELVAQVATLVEGMKRMREDLADIKKALQSDLPALEKRVLTLETEQLVWKARASTAAAIGSVLGGIVAFVVEKIW